MALETTVFQNGADLGIEKIAAIESRGFIIGEALAYKLGAGIVLVKTAPYQHFMIRFSCYRASGKNADPIEPVTRSQGVELAGGVAERTLQ